MYLHIGWTEKDLKTVEYFLEIVDDYLIPFKNMRIDGDLRYNFNKNFTYLEKITSDNSFVFKLIGESFFTDVQKTLDENNRDSRKFQANKIIIKYQEVCKTLNDKVNSSKKYAQRK